jgi:hypothetical protein
MYAWFLSYICAGLILLGLPQSIKDFQRNTDRVFCGHGVSVKWIEELNNGFISFAHDEGFGRSYTATNEDIVESALDMVLLRRRVSEVTNHLRINHGSAYKIIHDRLGFHEICARWVPRNSQCCIIKSTWTSCQHHFDSYDYERDESSLSDETWMRSRK